MKSLVIVLLIITSTIIHAGGTVESGKATVTTKVDEKSYVPIYSTNIDSILDEYPSSIEIPETESFGISVSQSSRSIPIIGGNISVQVEILSKEFDFVPGRDFNYIIFFNNSNMLIDPVYTDAVVQGINKIFDLKSPKSNIYFMVKNTKQLKLMSEKSDLKNIVELLKNQTGLTLSDFFGEIKNNLLLLMESEKQIENGNPNKFFWILDKPIAGKQQDINDVYSIIAGKKKRETEISFCSDNENFRATTLAFIVNNFGGNSFSFSNYEEISKIIEKDYRYYMKENIGDLEVTLYPLATIQNIQPKTFLMKKLGSAEYHSFILPIQIFPKEQFLKARFGNEGFEKHYNIEEDYPLCIVYARYTDIASKKEKYITKKLSFNFTEDYTLYMESINFTVLSKMEIINSYKLINEIAQLLTKGDVTNSLMKLNNQIEKLVKLNETVGDNLIQKDIDLLIKYKDLIFENRTNPLNGLKIFFEIVLKK